MTSLKEYTLLDWLQGFLGLCLMLAVTPVFVGIFFWKLSKYLIKEMSWKKS